MSKRQTWPPPCTNADRHTPEPTGLGYIQWFAWAEEMGKTHTQKRCGGCGLWKIWEPREPAPPVAAREGE